MIPAQWSGPMAARSAARLAAVQALYQMDLGGVSLQAALDEVSAGRLPRGEDGPLDVEVDTDLFRQILTVVLEQQQAVDVTIAAHLADGWRLERLDSVARALLRAGVAELWARRDVPKAVVIDEAIEIAHAFFEGVEPKFVNATLDACARSIRGDNGEPS